MIPRERLSAIQSLMQHALKVLEGGNETALVAALTALDQVVAEVIPKLDGATPAPLSLDVALSLLGEVIYGPHPAHKLSGSQQISPALGQLYYTLLEMRDFFLALAKGDLSRELRTKGFLAGSLKTLQANLRHLTWQTQMIASGDFSQRVDFMGEFSIAFNTMVMQLEESQKQIKEKEMELLQINQDLRTEVELRKKTEESLRHSEEMYRQLAILDPLTGIYNRRHFFQLALAELHRSCRYLQPMAVIMFDLDHFKRVNDTFGHAIGDQVLQAFAELVRTSLRTVDIFARYGGEEFIVLLPQTDLHAGVATAERVRVMVAETPLAVKPQQIQTDCQRRSQRPGPIAASGCAPAGRFRSPHRPGGSGPLRQQASRPQPGGGGQERCRLGRLTQVGGEPESWCGVTWFS